ncbi:MAG: patatin-like phospholipase family protein, partial [Daejeonella sp.]|nr:patatin-like phospholipase family protein [Daejeonella sp.]
MNKYIYFLVIFLFSLAANAQKVGLVFSGGGAKGLAHIGVLKALEENNIPIDYIVGTSMGGIVGGMYASGYSPEEIETIALSPDFQNWVSGHYKNEY